MTVTMSEQVPKDSGITRKFWQARIREIILYEKEHGFDASDVERWADACLKIPAIALAVFAESKPEYRLAVVDRKSMSPLDTEGQFLEDWYKVIQMEEE